MTQEIHIDVPAVYNPVDSAVADWLAAKFAKSSSNRTAQAYRDTMAEFRAALATRNADLFDNPSMVAMVAEQWAAASKTGRQVTPATFNLRLAIVSSFYVYYAKKAILTGQAVINPIQAIDRHKVQAYGRAMPLSVKAVKAALKAVDRSTLQGKRDYAMLWVFISTGRRLNEVAAMTVGDLLLGDQIVVTFPHCKGGKSMSDRLEKKPTEYLIQWLSAYYGTADLLALPKDTPVWVSLSRRNYGKPLGAPSTADICEKHFGTGKVHTLRHTFAVMMQDAGASISEIQHRLGHSSAATTSIYLEQLHAADNPFAGKLFDMIGGD